MRLIARSTSFAALALFLVRVSITSFDRLWLVFVLGIRVKLLVPFSFPGRPLFRSETEGGFAIGPSAFGTFSSWVAPEITEAFTADVGLDTAIVAPWIGGLWRRLLLLVWVSAVSVALLLDAERVILALASIESTSGVPRCGRVLEELVRPDRTIIRFKAVNYGLSNFLDSAPLVLADHFSDDLHISTLRHFGFAIGSDDVLGEGNRIHESFDDAFMLKLVVRRPLLDREIKVKKGLLEFVEMFAELGSKTVLISRRVIEVELVSLESLLRVARISWTKHPQKNIENHGVGDVSPGLDRRDAVTEQLVSDFFFHVLAYKSIEGTSVCWVSDEMFFAILTQPCIHSVGFKFLKNNVMSCLRGCLMEGDMETSSGADDRRTSPGIDE